MSILKNLVRFALLAYLIVFAYLNSGSVHIALYPGEERDVPAVLLVIAAIAIGAAVMYLTMIIDQLHLKAAIKRKQKRLHQLEDENRKLKEVTVEKIPVEIPKGHSEHADTTQD
ncbi:LapA family protein [Desulfurispirillum indicum]|uniref:lipopolysaccharide assembly protein LapA domain-containing protein n=1 Tax=Desulfurispirillum indicum TaxID=936456 RepID=UPI001CFC2DBC|nr:LapA family protein [Desulfurispirillum indicum]UCZ55931.1 LapA family protein [Desulfurispirillum indicum]